MKEFEGCHVILADDDEVTRKTVINIVEGLGAACETAQNGMELIKKLNGPKGEAFDLVLTDINMPQKGGIEACAEFRGSNHPKAKTLPFIGMSDGTDRALFDRAISAGMNSMTLKPITRDVLYAHFILTLRDNQANTISCERVQEAIAAAKAKSYFFSTVSHDIRTPLNAIIGFSQLLKMGFKTEEERQQAIDSILVSGKTLLGLINDVLDLSKLESGKMEISPEPTDCPRLLHAVLAVFRVSIAKKTEVELRCQVEPMPLLMLDPQRLRQIVFNLVGNAIKFTSKGSIEVRASFDRSAGSETGVCRIDVEDTGCGISAENLKHLGSAYVQVGDKRARNGGTGLGLAICQQLVLAMGGELKVRSALGEGSIFSVIIPGVKVVSENATATGTAGTIGTTGTAGTIGTTGTAGTNGADVTAPQAHPIRRILLVDDSKMNLLVLKALLKKLGNFEVATAENGQEALTQLQTPGALPVDLVLTDMWMPELDGTGLVKAIRADPALASLRVIAVTADTEFQGRVADLGFDGMLLKPVTLERLSGILGVSE